MVFLIDFEAIETDSGIYIVGIDVQNISIWMNLTTPDGSNTVVSPDYTFNYLTVLGESCSIVSIIVIT